ncbi:hypothetical protein GQ44DRAFT_778890 [Phaeosphaeriaceae sp. PMI808]|nr:hypothetical protein GQ44DRAFT_778890 [Phaeosphaeriaceae sp. PMI808]
MYKTINLQVFLAYFLASIASAAGNAPETACESSAWVASRGDTFTLSVSTNGTCDVAALFLRGKKSTEMNITLDEASCKFVKPEEKFFQIQLSKTAPLGEAQLKLVCDDYSKSHCIRFWIEDSATSKGFDSNRIKGVCPPLSADIMPLNSSQPATQSRPPIESLFSSQLSTTPLSIYSNPASVQPSLTLTASNATLSVTVSVASLSQTGSPLVVQSSQQQSPAETLLSAKTSIRSLSAAVTTELAQSLSISSMMSLSTSSMMSLSTSIMTSSRNSTTSPFAGSAQNTSGACTCSGG